MRQHAIEMNWRSKPIRPPKMLKGHDDHVITCLQFCGNRIVSGSDDNTLKVWSASSGKVSFPFVFATHLFIYFIAVHSDTSGSHRRCVVFSNVRPYNN